MLNKRLTYHFILLITIVLTVMTASCTDFGVFSYIAVSDKVEEGLLPEGASASKALSLPIGYDFISTGGALWARENTDRGSVTVSNRWETVALPSGWKNVQSIDQTNSYIIMTVVREDRNKHEVGLYYFSAYTPAGGADYKEVSNTNWTDDGESYYNVYVFCPNPAATNFYVNVLKTSKTFGESSWIYNESKMYLKNFTETWDGTDQTWTNLEPVDESARYIDSAAFGGGEYVFSAIQKSNALTDNGLLLNDGGGIILATAITRPVRGITYLNGGGFICGASSLDAELKFPIYATTDSLAANTWYEVPGTSSSYRAVSFIDVRNTEAGGGGVATDRDNKILAGTSSFSSNKAVGYVEIVTEADDTDPTTWTILTGLNRTFALPTNLLASDLVEVSINDFATYDDISGDTFIYASTSIGGLWHLNADDYVDGGAQPAWVRE